MRDIFILLMLVFLFVAACKRPFLMTLAYLYVDLFQPQQVSYYLVNTVPVSMIFGAAAVGFFLVFDEKRDMGFTSLQGMMMLFLGWVTFTTFNAQIDDAWTKWDPAWKAIIFGVYLPFVLKTRQRLEAAVLTLILCVGAITVTGGIKTILGGGGYGTISLLVDSNTGLYESSTISAVSVALIPLVIYSYRFNKIVPKSRLTLLVAMGLIFSSALIPVGTEARTGLVCLGVLAALNFLRAKRKVVYAAVVGVFVIAAIPLLPQSFTERMGTIKTHSSDNSASTRVAVWMWTMDFVKSHPFGGGFYAYKLNEIEVVLHETVGEGNNAREVTRTVKDKARAFHSSYFEVLGEHGYPGITIFMLMLLMTLLRLRSIYVTTRQKAEDNWSAELAIALSHCIMIYMVGSLFLGAAFQSTLYYLIGMAASLQLIARRSQIAAKLKADEDNMGRLTAQARNSMRRPGFQA
ncbi:putative O-glycosylation ligase, exosortase A system-associated [Sphingoaurantiacus capsulatus]|uniref:O-glycosylation ligase, exosortase A system-associated n=1 Tax=Sphingoaurantiacus capsulatus TaxID=1771310 RepID=A0ABV7XDC3_9SPHN